MDLSDLSKLRVVDLKQELQNRGLDTKGVKAILIERLREAMSAEGDDNESNDVDGSSDGGAPDESILPDEESSDARGVTTHSPSPEPPAPPVAPDEAIVLEESESTDIVMHESSEQASPDTTDDVPEVQPVPEEEPAAETPEEAMQEEAPQEVSEKEDVAPNEEFVEKVDEPTEADEEKKDIDDSAVDAYTQNETMPMDEVEKKAKEEEEAKKVEGDKKRRRSPSPEQADSRRRPRHDSQTAHADDFMNIEDEPALPENPSLSWVDSDLQVKISGTDFCEARTLSDGVLGLMWAGARATHGVTKGKTFYEVQLLQKNTRINYPDETNLFDLRCGWSTLKTDLYLGQSEKSFAFDGEGKKVTGGTEEDFGVKFTAGDVIGVYLDMETDTCRIQFTVNGEDQGVAFEFEKEKLGGEALFPHILTKNLTFKVNFGQLENTLLSEFTPRKREKPETPKKSPEGEEKKDEEEAPKPEGETAEKPDGEASTEGSEEKVPEEHPEGTEEKSNAPADGAEESQEKMEVEEEVPEKPINRETLPDFIFISHLPREELAEGLRRVETRKECEVIMMIGLPGAGKTHWVTKWNEENPEKLYNIIGNKYLYDRMNRSKISKAEKFNDMCNRSFTVLQELAQKRRRNYIFDQTNVYASAQRRKMKGFGDFKRIAVIVIPDDEEYKRRVASRNEGGSKELADYAVNEMKANFSLPTLDLAWFDEIKYVELEEESATKLVQEYMEKGRKALPQKRRNYDDNRDRRRRDYGNDRRWDRGDRRDRWDMGGYRGPSGWRPPPPRDYYGGGGYDRRDRWNNDPNWVSGNRRYERDYRRDYASRDYPRNRDTRDSRSGRSGRDQDFRERRSDNRGGGGDNYGSRTSQSSSRSNRRDYSSSSRESGSSAKSYGGAAYGSMAPGGAAMATQGGAAWGGWQQQQQWPMANWGAAAAQGWNQGGWGAGGQNWGGWDQWSGQAANGAEWTAASWDVNQAAHTTNSRPNVDPTSGQTN
uniref:Putative heteroproteinous nuclear ribonucleoprotein u-like protein 1 n=1 Tax=Nyssomyia neivai TaxID=330878 RepID=A0A1L8DCX0_9DIPT